jgi:hypothetical protein
LAGVLSESFLQELTVKVAKARAKSTIALIDVVMCKRLGIIFYLPVRLFRPPQR